MNRFAVLGALLIAFAAASAAPSIATAPPIVIDNGPAAREFAAAAHRLRAAVKAQGPELQRRLGELESRRCNRVARQAPERIAEEVVDTYYTAVGLTVIDSVRSAVATYVAELDQVQVGDAALRKGRAAWRSNHRTYAALPPVPPDICAQLERWRASGYTRATKPRLAEKAYFDLAYDQSPYGDDYLARRRKPQLRAGARRMRELGVARPAARRFSGDVLLRGVAEFDDEAIFK